MTHASHTTAQLTENQREALEWIDSEEILDTHELAALTGWTYDKTHSLLARLEWRGLVKRLPNPRPHAADWTLP